MNEGRILGSVRHTKKRFSANKKCGHGNGRGGVCSAHEAIPLHFTVVPHVGAFGQSQAADGRRYGYRGYPDRPIGGIWENETRISKSTVVQYCPPMSVFLL